MIITTYRVSYKGKQFDIYVDGGGLDMINIEENTDTESHELFCKVVDSYPVIGLEAALANTEAVIITVSDKDNSSSRSDFDLMMDHENTRMADAEMGDI